MGLREIESALPPGFRFHPNDEELVCHYLYKKVAGEWPLEGTMVEVDLHTQEPWELPDVAKLSAKEWYFFSFRDRKYATGLRTNRATKSGYWKATGKDRTICDPMSRCTVGMRKTLVFYRGRAPNGMKTDWVMHEFRLESSHSPPKEDWVLCRVFHKSKGENTDQDNTTTTAAAGGSSFPTLRSPTPPGDQQLMPDECCQVQMDTSNLTCTVGPPTEEDNSAMNPFLNLAQLLQCNFLDLPPAQDMSGTVPAVMMGMSPRGGSTDQQDGSFGFFMNCGFEAEDHDMGEAGLMASLGGGRHQCGHHNFYF